MDAPYVVVVDPDLQGDGYELRGGCRDLLASKDAQVILSGPADTGKTVASCIKVHLTCLRYPGSQHAIIRKAANSCAATVLKTFARIIPGAGVRVLGADSPRLYTYPNGSQVWVAGMDDPDKALSSERDTIYVNQAEELSENDWEMLSTRCTGRAAVVPHAQLFGDCNPGGSLHWILGKAKAGTLRLLKATHKDNPTIYDEDGDLIPEARPRLDALDALTGVRRKRLRDGVWATAEGAVYEDFDTGTHVLERSASEFRCWYLAIDEGYTNPAVILLVGEDSDGRWHVAREFYQRGKLQAAVVDQARQWFGEFRCELVAVDEAAAGLIADLKDAGVRALGGKGRVLDGIQVIQNRLALAGDQRPRLTFDPSCVNLVNEFESYVWKPNKDEPVKEHDHTSDALRYLAHALGERPPALRRPELVRIAAHRTTTMKFKPSRIRR